MSCTLRESMVIVVSVLYFLPARLSHHTDSVSRHSRSLSLRAFATAWSEKQVEAANSHCLSWAQAGYPQSSSRPAGHGYFLLMAVLFRSPKAGWQCRCNHP